MLGESGINREWLDQLVDGELSDQDYGKMLLQLEETPDGWRHCALSFLEQQALQRDLRQILNERVATRPRSELLDSSRGTRPVQERSLGRAHSAHWLARPWVRWSSVMAVGILAFVGSIAFRPFGPPGGSAVEEVARTSVPNSNSAIKADMTDDAAGSNMEPALLYVDGGPTGTKAPLEVPVAMIADSNGRPKFASERFSPQLAHLLEGSNYPNRVERMVYFVRTDDGKLYILPFDRIVRDDYQ